MRPIDAFVGALENLAAHKLRSALTMLGMMFGVGAVIAMLSIGAGAEEHAMGVIDRMGVRNVIVRGKRFDPEELKELRKKSLGLSMLDVEAIEEAIFDLEMVVPRLEIEPYKILSKGGKTEAAVFGVSRRQGEILQIPLAEGRFFDLIDERHHAQVCVLGAGARRDLFGAGAALGEHVKINDIWVEVVGVLAPDDVGADEIEGVAISSRSREIYLPFTTALRKFDRDPMEAPLHEIMLRTSEGASSSEVANNVSALLDRLHGGARDYEIIVPQALLDQSRQTQRLFDLVMGCIAGISLLVGGIGIMNIMLASVLEQTRAIGISRAVGARRRDIRFLFLVTSFALSAFGGLAGIVLGIAIANVVAAYAGWPTVVTAFSVVLSTGVSVTVGVVSGLYPAMRAAALDPIDALRHE